MMVIGHSGAPDLIVRWIYNFHMPLFFFVSGFLFNPRHIDSKWPYVKKKIKTLWVPYVKWSLLFLVFHNFLASLHIYNTVYTGPDIMHKIAGILSMTDSEQLLGGVWFLKQLLYTSIICCFILYGINRSRNPKYWLPVSISIIILLQIFFEAIPFHIPTISTITLNGILFFLTGHLISKYGFRFDSLATGVTLLAITIIISIFYHGNIETHGLAIIIYFMVALASISGTICLCNSMLRLKTLSLTFDKLGEMTIYILIFHFPAFKIVSAAIIQLHGMSVARLSEFPVLKGLENGEYILYTLAGILIPVFLYYVKIRLANIKSRHWSKDLIISKFNNR